MGARVKCQIGAFAVITMYLIQLLSLSQMQSKYRESLLANCQHGSQVEFSPDPSEDMKAVVCCYIND